MLLRSRAINAEHAAGGGAGAHAMLGCTQPSAQKVVGKQSRDERREKAEPKMC